MKHKIRRHTLWLSRAKIAFAGLLLFAGLVALYLLIYSFTPARWNTGWRFGATLSVLCGSLAVALGSGLVLAALRIAGSRNPGDLLGQALERRTLARGPRIVVIGGGTGLSVLLRGLKAYTSHLTAVVAVTDDGGSSGRLRDEFGILPPGDIRNCLTALADRESLMEQLFRYRFGRGAGLAGHNFGNLFITAMTDITGDFQEAIRQSSRVLAIRGQVLPSTLETTVLAAELDDGAMLTGETLIGRTKRKIKRAYLIPSSPPAPAEAVQAIMNADAVVMGPGSLFTSIMPNLLVPDILRAVRRTTALRLFVVNIMTQEGETADFTAADHIEALQRHGGPGLVDWAIINDEIVPPDMQVRYRSEGAVQVAIDSDRMTELGVKAVTGPLLGAQNVARHDPDALAALIMRLIEEKGQWRQKWQTRLRNALHSNGKGERPGAGG